MAGSLLAGAGASRLMKRWAMLDGADFLPNLNGPAGAGCCVARNVWAHGWTASRNRDLYGAFQQERDFAADRATVH